MIVDTVYQFDSRTYNDEEFIGTEIPIKCGYIYKFDVVAGTKYEWNTDISHNRVPTALGEQLHTKITLFYDDFQTPAIVSDVAKHSLPEDLYPEIAGLAAAGLVWIANFTGTVGVMVTRGDRGVDTSGDYCGCNEDTLYLRFDKVKRQVTNLFVWGRYGTSDTLVCDNRVHYIYDSGMNTSNDGAPSEYANNEDGYLVLYPGDPTSKLKLWGDCRLEVGDTLFIYNGDITDSSNIQIPSDTLTGQFRMGNEDEPIFISNIVGQPITLRMKSDSSCALTGFELQAKCCLNPGLPTDLVGEMTSDTSAWMHWHPAEGNELVYNWELFRSDTVSIATGSTTDTTFTYDSLSPNQCYFYTISVKSACSNDNGGDEDMDVVYSDLFCYPYFVTLGGQTTSFDFNTDSLYLPEGAYYDTIWVDSIHYEIVTVHESDLRVCKGQQANICYSFSDNVELERVLVWKTSYDSLGVWPVDSSYLSGDTSIYTHNIGIDNFNDCFRTVPILDSGYVILEVYTDGLSLARAVMHIIVDTIPDVYLTVNNIDTSDYTTCEGSSITLQGRRALRYTWTNSINSISRTATLFSESVAQDIDYYLTGTDFHNCSASDTLHVHVNRLPDLIYVADTFVCRNDSILLRVEGISDYTWERLDTVRWDTTYMHLTTNVIQGGPRFLSQIYQTIPIPNDSTYYIYTVSTFPNRCIDTITIAQLQDTAFHLSYLDSTTKVYKIGYFATDHNIQVNHHLLAQGTMDSLWVSPDINTDYLVTGTDTNGCHCRRDAIIHVTVHEIPTSFIICNQSELCVGESIDAQVLQQNGCTYLWWDDIESNAPISDEWHVQYIPDSIGSHTLKAQVTNEYGCHLDLEKTFEVHPLPTIIASAVPDTICLYDTTQLIASGNAISYTWTGFPEGAIQTIVPDQTTYYTVSGIDRNGCRNIDSTLVFVKHVPSHEYIDDQHICAGDSITIATTGDAVRYVWSTNGQAFSEQSNISLLPATTTLYHLDYTYVNGCSSETDFIVNVHEYPTPNITPIDTICRGTSIYLTASGGTYFQWNDNPAQTTDSLLITPDSTSTYHLMVYDTLLCPAYDSIVVPVIPFFNLTLTSSRDSICQGQSVIFTVTGGDEYLWSNGSHNNRITISLDTTTIVSVSAVNYSTNCSHTVYDTVIVMPKPVVDIIASQDTICSGQPVTLTAAGTADRYHWNNTGSNELSITAAPATSTNYTLTGFDDYGSFTCTRTSSHRIVVNQLPEMFNILLQDDSICYTDSTLISIDTTFYNMQYHWSVSGIPSTDASFFYVPTFDQQTLYSDTIQLVIEDQNGCTRQDTAVITVLPMPRDEIVSPDEVCFNESFTLSLSGDNHYQWYNPISSSQANQTEITARILQNTTFSVKVTNDYGCELTLSKPIIVNTLPSVHIEASNPYSRFCSNQSYTLTATGASTYVWSTGESGNTITVTPTQTQHYYRVTGTDENGCQASSNITLQVANPPTVSLSVAPSATICAFDTITITADGIYDTIRWNTGFMDHSFTVSDLTTSTQYIATATLYDHGTPCTFTDTIDIFVQPVPALNVSSESPICSNSTGTITVSGADHYHWLPNNLLDTLQGNRVTVTPTASTVMFMDTFTVIGEFEQSGCRTVATIPFTISPLPAISIVPSSNQGICLGDTITLLGSGGLHYYWAAENSPQNIIGRDSIVQNIPSQTTTYLMWTDNEYGCFDTTSITIPVYPHPTLAVQTSDNEICYGFSTSISATSNGNTYQWDNAPSLGNANASSTIATPLASTRYTVTVTNNSTGCSTTDYIDIEVHPSPQIISDISTGVCATDTLGVTISGASTYQWFYENLTDVIHTGSYYEAPPITLPVTTYTVIGTDEYGCRDTLEVPVMVNAIPELSISVSSPGYLCKNGSNFLGITTSSNIPNTIFEWSAQPSDPSMSSNGNVAFVAPDTTTIYTVIGHYSANGTSCSATISEEVIVYDAPSVTATGVPNLICHNSEVTMTATGASRYMWYNEGEVVGLSSTYSTIPHAATSYIVAGIDDRNCIGRDTVDVIFVNEPPTDTILSSTDICYNTPTEIRTTGRNHCYWYPQTGLSNISDSSVTITLTEDMEYQLVITNEFGCVDTMTVPIHVNPVPVLSLSRDTVICKGNSFSFRVTGGISYDWNDGTHNDFMTVTPDTTTTYIVTGYNEYHCATIDSITVRVLPRFDLSIIASQDTFCFAGEPITLTAYGAGDNYIWSTGSRDSIITVYPDQTSTYSLTAFNNTVNCDADTSITIVQMEHPIFTLGATQQDICVNESTTVFVQTDSANSILWNNGEHGSSLSVSPTANTLYIANVSNDFGCTISDTISIRVHPLPEIGIVLSDTAVCFGQSITCSVSGNAVRYEWSTGDSSASISESITSNHNISLVGYSEYGCASYDTVAVHALPSPDITLSQSDSIICIGDTVTLQVQESDLYTWNGSNIIGNNHSSSISVNPDTTSIYQIIATNEYGCQDSASVTVNVHAPLPLQITPDTTICNGSSVTLFVTGSWNYLWNTGSSSSSINVSPNQTTQYSVSSTDLHGCITTTSTTVTLLPDFDIAILHSRDTICVGEAVTLWYDGNADQHLWNTGSTASSIIVTPSETSIYNVTATNDAVHCSKIVSDTIIVLQHPQFGLSQEEPICAGDTFSVSATHSFPFQYTWETLPITPVHISDANNFITVAPTQSIQFVYHATNHICTLTDTLDVEIAPLPIVKIIASDSAVCHGNTLLLSADGNAERYLWSTGSTDSSLSLSNEMTETVFELTGFSEYGCISKDTALVTIWPLPTATLTGADHRICPGDTVTLSVNDGYQYQWTPEQSLLSNDSSQVQASPLVPTHYQVVMTNIYGCKDSLTTFVDVYSPLPLEISPDTAICYGTSATVSVTGSWNYLWNTGETSNTFSVSPTQTTQYSVSSTDINGCVTTVSTTVTVHPDFDVVLLHSRDTICLGESVTLWHTGSADHYTWSNGSNEEFISISPTETSIYNLSASNFVNNCSKTLSDTIVVLPYPQFEISQQEPICAGDTFTAAATHFYPFQYTWETLPQTPTLSSDSNNSITIAPVLPTRFVYHASNHICTLTDTLDVDIMQLPIVSIIASDSAVCYGNTLHLSADGNAQRYFWSNGSSNNHLSLTDLMSDTPFELTGFSEYGCISKDTAIVSIRPLPTATITGVDYKICPGDTITLSVTDGYQYQWTPVHSLLSNASSQVQASPLVPTNFQVVMTNIYGCKDSLTTFVDVYDPLPLEISADTAICYGTSATVSVTGSWNYIWNTGATVNTFIVSPIQTTQYSVSSTDLNGCVTTVSTTVTVHPDFDVELLHARDTICLGETVTLWYTGSADQYIWSTGSSEDNITVSPTETSIYNLTAINNVNNCSKTLSDTIVVLPYPQFELDGPALMCAGDTITVWATHSYPFQYSWETLPSAETLSPDSSSFITVSPVLPTAFVYHATNHICTLTDTLLIDVSPLPLLNIENILDETCEQGNGSISISGQSTFEPLTYLWSNGSNTSTIEQLHEGNYSVTVTDALGCHNTLDGIEVVNIPPPAVEVIAIEPVLNIIDGYITIDITDHHGDYTIAWYEQKPPADPLPQYENSTTAYNVHTGTYWVSVTDDACSTIVTAIVPQIDAPESGLWVPNCITASNTDGLNDKFQILYSGKVEFHYIRFYNRWGELVYESHDINEKWDGSYKGQIFHNVVYNYILEYVNYNGTRIEKRGSLTVL